MVTLQTPRLTLRALQPDDARKLVEIDSDPQVQEFLGEVSPSLDGATAWIATVNSRYPSGSRRGFWAAEESGAFIGWFHLRPS